jgi:serine/threonine-protein kinase
MQPGETFGPFRLRELINSGGMADLWLVTDSKEQPFALRVLKPGLRFNFLAKKRFIHGCEVLSKIHNHDHVIKYFEHGKIEGTWYLLMEYIEGANLREMMNKNESIIVEKVWDLLLDMATALEHVHESGFIHLDFKPEQIIVTHNAQIRLIDFDLAQPKPDKPKKLWKYPGTPAYMAPEMLLHGKIDHRADIFAYGVSAYELLTRRKPFPGENPKEILQNQINKKNNLIPPREHNPDIPPGVEKLILKCIEIDPDRRYPFMSVVIRDLKFA